MSARPAKFYRTQTHVQVEKSTPHKMKIPSVCCSNGWENTGRSYRCWGRYLESNIIESLHAFDSPVSPPEVFDCIYVILGEVTVLAVGFAFPPSRDKSSGGKSAITLSICHHHDPSARTITNDTYRPALLPQTSSNSRLQRTPGRLMCCPSSTRCQRRHPGLACHAS